MPLEAPPDPLTPRQRSILQTLDYGPLDDIFVSVNDTELLEAANLLCVYGALERSRFYPFVQGYFFTNYGYGKQQFAQYDREEGRWTIRS